MKNHIKNYILVINGPMLAGKSTLTGLFLKEGNTLRISSDAVKWLIGGYDAENVAHRNLKEEMAFSLAETGVRNGLSLLVDGGHAKYRNKLRELAEKYEYHYLSINLEAPKNILEKRFQERVLDAKKRDFKKISVTTKEGFDSRYEWYVTENKDSDAMVFDTAENSPEEVFEKVRRVLSEKISK